MTKEEKKAIIISYAEHLEDCNNWQYLTNARKNFLKKQNDIFNILFLKYDKKEFNFLEFEEAKKIYNTFKRLNRLNDQLLELENNSYFMEKRKKFIDNLRKKADQKQEQLKELIKKYKYNIKIVYYSWLASLESEKGQPIYFNFCM